MGGQFRIQFPPVPTSMSVCSVRSRVLRNDDLTCSPQRYERSWWVRRLQTCPDLDSDTHYDFSKSNTTGRLRGIYLSWTLVTVACSGTAGYSCRWASPDSLSWENVRSARLEGSTCETHHWPRCVPHRHCKLMFIPYEFLVESAKKG